MLLRTRELPFYPDANGQRRSRAQVSNDERKRKRHDRRRGLAQDEPFRAQASNDERKPHDRRRGLAQGGNGMYLGTSRHRKWMPFLNWHAFGASRTPQKKAFPGMASECGVDFEWHTAANHKVAGRLAT